jgi:hypothetical protein
MEQAISINTHHVKHIRELLFANPQWGRTRLSVELCKQWDWKCEKVKKGTEKGDRFIYCFSEKGDRFIYCF